MGRLVVVEIPESSMQFARRRAGPIVTHAFAIDLAPSDAAALAYLQGVRDTVEVLAAQGWKPSSPEASA